MEGNPINLVDPSGNHPGGPPPPSRNICNPFWDAGAVKSRVDEAERYMSLDRRGYSYTIDTYTAAGIAIQCAGWDGLTDDSGMGGAQISNNQVKETYGISVGPEKSNRGYGLKCFIPIGAKDDGSCSICMTPDEMKDNYGEFYEAYYQLENEHDQTTKKWAVIYMRRRLQIVTNTCQDAGCSQTDIYIAAALAQNGPGFTKFNLDNWFLVKKNRIDEGGVTLNWKYWFEHNHDNADDTSDQLSRFILVTDELKRRGWYVPNVSRQTILDLSRIGD